MSADGEPMATAQPAQKFKLDKSTVGNLSVLVFHGVIDEGFEGKKAAEATRTSKVVLNLNDVRRFASWGMAEWMNYLQGSQQRDVYLIECSTYAVGQMNLVTGLLGNAKLVSFYVPYRCASCGEEFQRLLVVPRDRQLLRDLAESEEACATCGRMARIEKYPAAIVTQISDRPQFDVDDEVRDFLQAKLGYDLPADLTRFRAHRKVQKQYTYLRLAGNITTLPPDPVAAAAKQITVLDLANVVYDPGDLQQWRTFVARAMPNCSSLQLLDCPIGFLEHAVATEDLRDKLRVRTFTALYHCPSCDTQSAAIIDVAENLEQLSEGQVPTTSCPSCRAVVVATIGPEQVMRLPVRERDVALDAFLTKARNEPTEKLEDVGTVRAAPVVTKPTAPGAGSSKALYFGGAVLAAALAGGAVLLATQPWKTAPPQVVVDPNAGVVAPKPDQKYKRPEWLPSGELSASAFCTDAINRLVCVGVSAYRKTRDEGVTEATDAALEELTNTIGLKATDPFFKDQVISTFSESRTKALAELQELETDRTSVGYRSANDAVRKVRKRVAEILRASGGPAVPAQRSDWYWEEYELDAAKNGGKAGTETLVFVRFDISLDAIKALTEKYATPSQTSAGTLLTAFPSLAWKDDDFTGGAMVVKPGPALAAAGIGPKQIVLAVGDQLMADAPAFVRKLEESTGTVKVNVKAVAQPARVVDLTVKR